MIIGHQKILDFFKKGVVQQKLAHAFLFVGPAQVGKRTVSLRLAQMMQCEELSAKGEPCGRCQFCVYEAEQNPDIFIVSPQSPEKDGITKKEGEIKIEQIRNLQKFLSLSPYQAKAKVAIIVEAQAISREAATALLKTLEEPPPFSYIILTSSNWQGVLGTISSRCQTIKFNLVPSALIEKGLPDDVSASKAKKILQLSAGRPGAAIEYAQDNKRILKEEELIKQCQGIEKADFYERLNFAEKISGDAIKLKGLLESWQFYYRDLLLVSAGCAKLVLNNTMAKAGDYDIMKIKDKLMRIRQMLSIMQNPSFNLKLAVENLLLNL